MSSSQISDSGRIFSLDVLRGLAILGMALSGMLPWGTLPAWTYHAQVPPPEMVYKPEIPGITWVDLVFPFFLFAMGAAIPIALTRRVESQDGKAVFGGILLRGGLLAAFAFASQHFRVLSFASSPGIADWWLGLLFFGATALAFGRWPESWGKWVRWGLVGLGALVMILALWWLPSEGGMYGSVERVDIILLVLANVWVSGSLVWWVSRRRPMVRLAVMGLVAAVFLTNTSGGMGDLIWDATPLPWLYQFNFQKYLLIVIPGMFCGEWLMRHRSFREPEGHPPHAGWFVAVGSLGLSGLCCWGLFVREVELTFLIGLFWQLALWVVLKLSCASSKWQLKMGSWGFALVMIGILLDPLAGGIKKDPANLSYLLTTAGLAFWMLVGWSEIMKGRMGQSSWGWVAAVGANPLLGYVAITNLVPSVIRLTGLHAWVGGLGLSEAGLVGYSFVQVGMVALVCWVATRYRFFLRV